MTRRRQTMVLAAIAVAIGGAAMNPQSAHGSVITIKNLSYGDIIMVSPGETVRVLNEDDTLHNLVADNSGDFMTRFLKSGESDSFQAPTGVGSYDFMCTVNPAMKGTLIVGG